MAAPAALLTPCAARIPQMFSHSQQLLAPRRGFRSGRPNCTFIVSQARKGLSELLSLSKK